jgi:putative flippase GtrA
MYVLMGALTTLVNIIAYWISAEIYSLDYRLSTTIAWIAAVLFAYFTNKKYVFESETKTLREFLRELGLFFGFRFLSFFMDLGAMILLVDHFHIDGTISKILANVVVLVANYIFSKLFIFKNAQ